MPIKVLCIPAIEIEVISRTIWRTSCTTLNPKPLNCGTLRQLQFPRRIFAALRVVQGLLGFRFYPKAPGPHSETPNLSPQSPNPIGAVGALGFRLFRQQCFSCIVFNLAITGSENLTCRNFRKPRVKGAQE